MTPAPTEPTVAHQRGPRNGEFPTISVVVASSAASDDLHACLSALTPRCIPIAAQLIVVRASADAEMDNLRASMPDVRFLTAPPSSSQRELRRLGMIEAIGDIVVITNDHQVVDDAWAAVLLRAAHDPSDAASPALRPV